MPKRIVDSEGVALSKKLKQVQPHFFRHHFANLIPLAFANGSFECDADIVWAKMYSFGRPDVSVPYVQAVLDEFERVKLLFRWRVGSQIWGYWVGIEKPGRLPGEGRIKQGEKIGAAVPTTDLAKWLNQGIRPYVADPELLLSILSAHTEEVESLVSSSVRDCIGTVEGTHTDCSTGFGFCSGIGSGDRSGLGSADQSDSVRMDQVGSIPDSHSHSRTGEEREPESNVPAQLQVVELPDLSQETIQQSPVLLQEKQTAPTAALHEQAPPVGPTHPLAVSLLGYLGSPDALGKKGRHWDKVALELEQTYTPADLQGALDFIFSERSDGWWAKAIRERRSDPFDFIAINAEKIIEQYQRLRASQEAQSKRNVNKENSHVDANLKYTADTPPTLYFR
jgi:hypothetical protein